MGQVHVWKYILIVARNPSSVLSRNRKTELRITVDTSFVDRVLLIKILNVVISAVEVATPPE
jgi:hypothetical protein